VKLPPLITKPEQLGKNAMQPVACRLGKRYFGVTAPTKLAGPWTGPRGICRSGKAVSNR
jgi:hypothetical protein